MKKLALLLTLLSVLCVIIFAFTSCFGGCEHNYTVKSSSESTCSTLGSTTYQCTLCNETKTQKNATYGDHSYTETEVEATCLEGGYTLNSCKNCPNTFRSNQTPKSNIHDYEAVYTKKATCSSTGYVEYECSLCSHTYTEQTATVGHDYTKSTKSATCVSYASTTYQCKNCTYNYSEETGTKLASHTGKITCTSCGYSFRTILIAWLYENGTYSASSDAYIYTDSVTSEGTKHTIILSYIVDSDNLAIMYNLSDTYITILFNDVSSGSYVWAVDALGYQMLGQVSASSIYDSTTYLSYLSFDGYSSLTSNYQKLGASYFKTAILMADLVLLAHGENFSMYNFGFIYLSDPV